MAKKDPDAVENYAGGIDLVVERDSGNSIRILTGKKELSISFWKKLFKLSEGVLFDLNASEQKRIKKLEDALKRAEGALTWYVEDEGECDVDALDEVRKALKK